ncbi:GNAT family N-acetyltransferase [Azospirillum sp.]|uniref:GNAT family N-acetyltransferase n=1 Tax=Azospirillum sp. TaxID=34012 RepID=UPI003D764BCB
MLVAVRRLAETDAEAWRALRLEGLERHPPAFGADREKEAAEPLTFFSERIARTAVWGAFVDDALVGTVGFYVLPNRKESHKGMLWGMYVRESARGQGVAQALIEALLHHADRVVEVVQLVVGCDNHSARRLYERMGFHVYGLERRALKIEDRYYDEELRARYQARD